MRNIVICTILVAVYSLVIAPSVAVAHIAAAVGNPPPIVEIRVNGSPRLPAGTVVSVTVGGDCETAQVVRIEIGPAGNGTARVDLNGCTPTSKTIPSAHALVGRGEVYYCGRGVALGPGGTIGSVTLRPC